MSTLFEDLTYKVNGCAMKVHKTLGSGFQEVIYQRALAIEFSLAGIEFAREAEHDIFYNGLHVGTRRADFIVENVLVVELKALLKLEDVHLAQVRNYLTVYDYPVGLLINFGGLSLQYRKIFKRDFPG